MASLAQDPNGTKRVIFKHPDGKRLTIYLGKVPKKTAESVRFRVENLVACLQLGVPLDPESGAWVVGLADGMAKKLAAMGLIPSRQEKKTTTLAAFIQLYADKRQDVKPATKEIWQQGDKTLIDFFGASRDLADITEGDAEDYSRHMNGRPLKPNTVGKRLSYAKQLFRDAARRRVIQANPFAEIRSPPRSAGTKYYVSIEETQRLLEACPSQDWRTIIALCRFAGLRCPSEVLLLTWDRVQFDQERMIVRSPKTEHHEGKKERVVPITQELMVHLRDAHNSVPTGSTFVVTNDKLREAAQGVKGWRCANLRTQLLRILRRVDMKPWPLPFINLRSSCQTDFTQEFSEYIVNQWIGNSQAVARRHYLQVTEDHFARAAKHFSMGSTNSVQLDRRAAHNPAQQAAAGSGMEMKSTSHSTSKHGTSSAPSVSLQNHAQSISGWGGI